MKTKTLLCGVVFIVVVLIGVYSFADDEDKFVFYVPKRSEEIYGTWINSSYDGISYEQKIVYYYWGYGEFYRRVTNENLAGRFGFTIAEKWSDSEGNIWYKTYEIGDNDYSVYFTLNKISKDATVLEYVDRVGDYPTIADLNAKHPLYRIRYRQ